MAMPPDMTACHCVLCQDHGDEIGAMTERTIEQVREHGWQVILIPSDDSGPGWAFTIGLWHNHRLPELAMFGLDIHDMHACLNTLAEQSVAGRPPAAGEERHDILTDLPVVLKKVDYRWYEAFFGTAIMFYRRPPFPVLEVVWPDKDGCFPWQPESGTRYRQAQPQLWLPPKAHPAGVWTQDL